MPRPWHVLTERLVHELRVFRVRFDRLRSPRTGHDYDFVVLDGPDWVNVIPLVDAIDGERVVLIRQWRAGRRAVTLEIPGGLIDPGESPAEAAARELLEETGYVPSRLVDLGFIEPNPAIQTNRCHTFLAEGCRSAGPARLEPREDIESEEVPLREIPARIASGEIGHALVAVAFQKLDLHRAGHRIATTR